MAVLSALGQILTNNAAWKLTKTRALIKAASQNLRRDTECLNTAATRCFFVGQKHKLTSWELLVRWRQCTVSRRRRRAPHVKDEHMPISFLCCSITSENLSGGVSLKRQERASAQEAWWDPAADQDTSCWPLTQPKRLAPVPSPYLAAPEHTLEGDPLGKITRYQTTLFLQENKKTKNKTWRRQTDNANKSCLPEVLWQADPVNQTSQTCILGLFTCGFITNAANRDFSWL